MTLRRSAPMWKAGRSVKRASTVLSTVALVCACLLGGTAGAQETTTTVDTTTSAPDTTTSTPDTTTAPPTTADPTPTTVADTTTTVVPGPTDSTTTTGAGAPVSLPGQLVTAGSLDMDINFKDTPASSCTKSVDLAGGHVNVGFDDAGNVGGVYGMAPAGTGSVGLFMLGLGAVPAGIAILSVSDGVCEFEALGLGAFSATATSATLSGVAIGVHPGSYDKGDYIDKFNLSAKVGTSSAPASLDPQALQTFLLRDRPGWSITAPSTTTTTAAPAPVDTTTTTAAPVDTTTTAPPA